MLLSLLHILGYLISFIGCMTLTVSAVSFFILNEPTQWVAFLLASFLAMFLGISFVLGFRSSTLTNLQTREIFLLTFLAWFFAGLFSTFPFLFSSLKLSLTDAFFEAMSAITTTGATILTNISDYPKSILLWRAMLQWFGGIGIVIMALTVLPALKVGGMQLFQSEFSDRSEKILPQVSQLARNILTIYVGFTCLCIISLHACGLTWFDAICHGFTTLATGGLANYDNSIGHFQNPSAEWTIITFMLISSLPLITFVKILHRKFYGLLSPQIITYIAILATAFILMWTFIVTQSPTENTPNIRHIFFTIISIATTTGFTTSDYTLWGPFAITLIIFLSIIGACTGSTSGGVKVFRVEILARIASAQIKSLRSPHGIFHPAYQNIVINNKITASVITFLVFWFLTLVSVVLIGAFFGLDFITAFSGGIAITSNVGPGIGEIIGPSGSYAFIPTPVKWVYIIGMLLGRLEFVTILALISKSFWKN